MAKLLTPDQTMFESQVCSRCAGTGEHSYNQVDGRVCYGCGGQGVQLTKRGRAAADLYRSLFVRPITDVKVGDVVKVHGHTGRNSFTYYATVTEVDMEPKVTMWSGVNKTPIETVNFTTEHAKFGRSGLQAPSTATVVVKGTVEERIAARDQALAHQASLTKTGSPRKKLVGV